MQTCPRYFRKHVALRIDPAFKCVFWCRDPAGNALAVSWSKPLLIKRSYGCQCGPRSGCVTYVTTRKMPRFERFYLHIVFKWHVVLVEHCNSGRESLYSSYCNGDSIDAAVKLIESLLACKIDPLTTWIDLTSTLLAYQLHECAFCFCFLLVTKISIVDKPCLWGLSIVASTGLILWHWWLDRGSHVFM